MAVIDVPCLSTNPLSNGDDLHSAMALANPGDFLDLDHFGLAGRWYATTSPFQLTNKGVSTNYITLRARYTLGGSTLPVGRMVTLADANNMVRIATHSVNSPIFYQQLQSHHWAFQGIDMTAMSFLFLTSTSNLLGDLWQCDVPPDRDPAYIPHHFTFDRCMWHPNASEHGETPYKNFKSVSRGGQFAGAHISFTDCHFFDIWGLFPPAVFWDADNFPTGNTDNITGRVTNIVMSGGKARVTFQAPIGWSKDASGSSFAPKAGITLWGGSGTWSDVNQTYVGTPISPSFNAGLDRWETDTVDLETYHPTTFALTSYDVSGFGSFSSQFVTSGPNTGAPRIVTMMKSYCEGACATSVAGPGPWTVVNTRFEGFSYPIFFGGGSQLVPPANKVTVTSSSNPIDQVTLSSIGDLQVGDLINFKDQEDCTISDITRTSPAVMTLATPHRYPLNARIWNGEKGIAINGATGAWAPVLNYVPTLTVPLSGRATDSTHIALYTDHNATAPLDTSGLAVAFTTQHPVAGTVKFAVKTNHSIYEATKGVQEWGVGEVTNISHSPTPNRITYAFRGNGFHGAGTSAAVGNGAGLPVANGSEAWFNGLQPGDMTFTRCTFAATRYCIMVVMHDIVRENVLGPKGLWYSKSCKNVLFDGCTFEITGGSTSPKPTMPGLSLNLVTQDSSEPWLTNSNITARNCLFKDVAAIYGSHLQEWNSGYVSDGLVIENCLAYGSAPGVRLHGTGACKGAVYKHVTFVGTSMIIENLFSPLGFIEPAVFQDCILTWGTNGYQGTDAADLNRVGNLLVGPSSNPGAPWTPTDDWVANIAAVQFVDASGALAGGSHNGFQLLGTSPAKGTASDFKDKGVDFALLNAALTGGAVTLGVDAGAYALSGAAAILTGPPPPVTPLTYPGGSFTNRVFRVVRS